MTMNAHSDGVFVVTVSFSTTSMNLGIDYRIVIRFDVSEQNLMVYTLVTTWHLSPPQLPRAATHWILSSHVQ